MHGFSTQEYANQLPSAQSAQLSYTLCKYTANAVGQFIG